jgi:hypothetical protein
VISWQLAINADASRSHGDVFKGLPADLFENFHDRAQRITVVLAAGFPAACPHVYPEQSVFIRALRVPSVCHGAAEQPCNSLIKLGTRL